MKLISLSDFVLEKNSFGLFVKNDEQIRKYAKFLQRDLTLSMFLPCDSNEKPFKGKPLSPNNDAEWLRWENEEEYIKAKALILFDNVSYQKVESQKGVRFYSVGDTQVFNICDDGDNLYWHHYNIESLLNEYDETINVNVSF